MSDQSTQSSDTGTHKAGLFDIRFIIGGLIGIYGVILTVMGIFGGHTDKTKAAGININLWAGLVMLVIALAFGTWARLRPIVVPDHVETDEDDRPPAH
jgi:amino acid transporter